MLHGKKKEKKENRGNGMIVGSASILAVFTVLCMMVFGTLSLISAKTDYRLSEKNAETVRAYYSADSQGEQHIAELCHGLDTMGTIQQAVEAAGMVYHSREAEATLLLPAADSQTLSIVVKLGGDRSCEIETWKIINEPVSQPDANLPLWDGGEAEKTNR